MASERELPDSAAEQALILVPLGDSLPLAEWADCMLYALMDRGQR